MTPERMVIENLFRVVNKEQQDVDFILNPAQRLIDDNFARRMIIPKARQEGVSTYFVARLVARCLGINNTRAVIISHDAEATGKLLDRAKYFIETMKGPKPIIRNSNRGEITFPKRNATLYIGTAGSRSFGRGDTITDLHCSEVAYWPDPKRVMTGLLQAVPKATGHISIESTGNGAGNWYHSQCIRAAKGQSTFKLCFLPWQTFPEYQVPVSPDIAAQIMLSLRTDLQEPELVKAYHLSAAQILWRRMLIEDELDGDLYEWNKEYPSCLDDCFQAAGGGIFRVVNFVATDQWKQVDANYWKLEGHPAPNLHYIVGGDVAAGVGKDSSVAEIFCLETDEQVAEYINNKIEPDAFGIKLAEIGKAFGIAFIGCESNNHGILTLRTLSEYDHGTSTFRYPSGRIYRTPAPRRTGGKDAIKSVADLGVKTTARSKPYIIGTLRSALKDTVVIHSSILRNELSTFVELPDGSMGAAEGCHDDCVMAAAMAHYVKGRGALSLAEHPISDEELKTASPFAFESILEEMTSGRTGKTFPDYLTDFS